MITIENEHYFDSQLTPNHIYNINYYVFIAICAPSLGI